MADPVRNPVEELHGVLCQDAPRFLQGLRLGVSLLTLQLTAWKGCAAASGRERLASCRALGWVCRGKDWAVATVFASVSSVSDISMSSEEQIDATPSAGLKDLHSWAFLGDSGRIATASDGVFLYTPAGPNAQLDLFLRAHELFHSGRLQVQARHFDVVLGSHSGALCLGVWGPAEGEPAAGTALPVARAYLLRKSKHS